MSPLDEARRVQEEHGQSDGGCCMACCPANIGHFHQPYPCKYRRLADEVVRLSEIAASVRHWHQRGDDTFLVVSHHEPWESDEAAECKAIAGQCAFAPPAKGGEGD